MGKNGKKSEKIGKTKKYFFITILGLKYKKYKNMNFEKLYFFNSGLQKKISILDIFKNVHF
jgi:hypothetical protein